MDGDAFTVLQHGLLRPQYAGWHSQAQAKIAVAFSNITVRWSASRKESKRIKKSPRPVVLSRRPRSSRFSPGARRLLRNPASCEELTNIALTLREKVDLGPQQRYRLVGVGLSNFQSPEDREHGEYRGREGLCGQTSLRHRTIINVCSAINLPKCLWRLAEATG
jgi:hypothetical protein